MKIRISENQIRIRLEQKETLSLAEGKTVQTKCQHEAYALLVCRISVNEENGEKCSIKQGALHLTIPLSIGSSLYAEPRFVFRKELDDDLTLIVEKDLPKKLSTKS